MKEHIPLTIIYVVIFGLLGTALSWFVVSNLRKPAEEAQAITEAVVPFIEQQIAEAEKKARETFIIATEEDSVVYIDVTGNNAFFDRTGGNDIRIDRVSGSLVCISYENESGEMRRVVINEDAFYLEARPEMEVTRLENER